MGNNGVFKCVIAILAIANLLMAAYYAVEGRAGSVEFVLHAAIFVAFAGLALYATGKRGW